MSVWGEIRKKSLGQDMRAEDISFEKINELISSKAFDSDLYMNPQTRIQFHGRILILIKKYNSIADKINQGKKHINNLMHTIDFRNRLLGHTFANVNWFGLVDEKKLFCTIVPLDIDDLKRVCESWTGLVDDITVNYEAIKNDLNFLLSKSMK